MNGVLRTFFFFLFSDIPFFVYIYIPLLRVYLFFLCTTRFVHCLHFLHTVYDVADDYCRWQCLSVDLHQLYIVEDAFIGLDISYVLVSFVSSANLAMCQIDRR